MSTPYPSWLAGQRITAAGLNALRWIPVSQGADQTMVNNTTLTNTNLVLPGEVGATYYYNLLVSYGASISSDFKWAWSIPGDAALTRFTMGLQTGDNTNGQSSSTAKTVVMRRPAPTTSMTAGGSEDNTTTPGEFLSAYDSGMLTFGAAGVATVQFGCISAVAGAGTTFRASSYLLYSRVG